MKKLVGFMFAIIMLFTACGQNSPAEGVSDSGENRESLSRQEQYDLGVRYLSEGNYQEAIIAFSAAIEIDSGQAPVYVGRARAYVLSGETEENLTAARDDFETAIELDETLTEAWLGLADVYIRRGDKDRALKILQRGLKKTGGDRSVEEKIDELAPDPTELALEQYRIIAGQADTYFEYADYYAEATISYRYALVQLQPGDAVPTLLIEQNVMDDFFGYFGYVRVFQYDPERGSMYQPSDILTEGVAGIGGYRGGLSMMGDGNGIESFEMSSGTGETYITRVTLEEGSLIRTQVWTGRMDLIPDEISSVPIDWQDISDGELGKR